MIELLCVGSPDRRKEDSLFLYRFRHMPQVGDVMVLTERELVEEEDHWLEKGWSTLTIVERRFTEGELVLVVEPKGSGIVPC